LPEPPLALDPDEPPEPPLAPAAESLGESSSEPQAVARPKVEDKRRRERALFFVFMPTRTIRRATPPRI
jgi:hypothetical protein